MDLGFNGTWFQLIILNLQYTISLTLLNAITILT